VPEIDVVFPELRRVGDEVIGKELRPHGGVVDQNVEPAEGVDSPVDGGTGAIRVSHVRRHR